MSKKKTPNQLSLGVKKKTPKMPAGYYSSDKPNTNLRRFVDEHLEEHPYQPDKDEYDVSPFDEPISIKNRRSALNDLHIYWSKKPFDAVQSYVDHYTNPEALVLDPFVGSGGTVLCALRRGCSAIGIDLSPASTFITKYYCTPVDLDEFSSAFEQVIENSRSTLDWLYESRNKEGKKANTAYTVWSQVYRCERCLSYIPLGLCVDVPSFNKDGTPKRKRGGGQATCKACPKCYKRGISQEINTGSKRYGRVPLRSSIIVRSEERNRRDIKFYPFPEEATRSTTSQVLDIIEDGCESEDLRFDIRRLREIRDSAIPHQFPANRMMNVTSDTKKWGVLWRAGVADFQTIDEVFGKRALWALSTIQDSIRHVDCSPETKHALLGVFSSSLWNCSRMYRERKKGGGPQEGVYYLPPLSREVNVENVISGKRNTFMRANAEVASSIKSNKLLISTQTATDLSQIPSNSIDYIFTDPPYSWKVPYGELNFLWESFLGLNTKWHSDEVVISDVRGIDEIIWADKLRSAFKECARVLKPGRCLTLCYHDSAEGTWELVQDIMAECGFIPERVTSTLSIETNQKSLKQITSSTITKRDLIINFRKPKAEQLQRSFNFTGKEDTKTFREKVLVVIREFLTAHPGSTKDRIYDGVVSHMVRKGQLEAFDFDSLLSEIADYIAQPVKKSLFENEEPNLFGTHEIRRWYLKETADILDETESKLEDKAAKRLEKFMMEYLDEYTEYEGVHYSDLFEQYLPTTNKPRRQLVDWLWDYFYKTPEGTWRLPANDEEREEKRKQRETGSLRRIKTYVRLLETGAPIPERLQPDSDRTIADWIRQARRAGLYQQGKIIFEKGGLNLSRLEEIDEDLAMDVNEDYQVCLKRLGEKTK